MNFNESYEYFMKLRGVSSLAAISGQSAYGNSGGAVKNSYSNLVHK